tara:strand:- start:1162 stop:1944 length:783 start_codon:yes stop_codon:yes gene_type:complete
MKLLDTNKRNLKIFKSLKNVNKWQGLDPDNCDFAQVSLMPDLKICGGSKSANCMDECLRNSGNAKIFKNVNKGRQAKTNFLLNDRINFLLQLDKELFKFNKKCIDNNKTGFVRLNTISDYPYYKTGLMQKYSDLKFIDYTKIAKTLIDKKPSNYFLIFSFSGNNAFANQVRLSLKTSYPIAVVFYDGLPETFLGREVIDGDLSDINNVLEYNKIIGLKYKQTFDLVTGKKLLTREQVKNNNSGFIVFNEDLNYYNNKFLN